MLSHENYTKIQINDVQTETVQALRFWKNVHEETEEIRREKEKRKCDRKQTAS
jgi:hypothetical protein